MFIRVSLLILLLAEVAWGRPNPQDPNLAQPEIQAQMINNGVNLSGDCRMDCDVDVSAEGEDQFVIDLRDEGPKDTPQRPGTKEDTSQ